MKNSKVCITVSSYKHINEITCSICKVKEINPKTPYLRIYWYYINNNYKQIKPPLNEDRARDIKTVMTQVS